MIKSLSILLLLLSGISTVQAENPNLLNPDHSAWRFYTDGKSTWYYSEYTDYVDIQRVGNNTQLYQSGIKLEPDTTYRLHISAINAFVDRYEQMSVMVLQHKAPYKVYFKAIVPMPPTYTDSPDYKGIPEFEYTFTTPSKVDGDTRFMYYFNYAKAGDNYNMGINPTLVKV